jgi:N-acetylneuraminic acid mutarotase
MKTNKIVGQALRLPGEMRRQHQQRWAGGAPKAFASRQPALQILILLAALAFAGPLARAAWTPSPPDMQSWFSGDDTANGHIWQPVGTLYNHATDATAKGTAPSQLRQLSFADRVAYQRAIEEVYWHHRIWPRGGGERPDPKPSLDAVMSQAAIEQKVQDYLRNSELLEEEWQKPLTPEQLQAEIDRMAQHSKQPEVLRELFAALGNDPFVIAECLARPVLADRMITSSHMTQIKTNASGPKVMAATTAKYTLPKLPDAGHECTNDTWTPTSTTNAPEARGGHTAVWTGAEMIVWGGLADGTNNEINTGARYNPSTDSWTPTSIVNAPAGRGQFTTVWTGTEMIVWGGGECAPCIYFNTGGRYNPETDSWVATTTNGAPEKRFAHTAVWTGSEMIVWGGNNGFPVNSGGRYNPNSDSWIDTSTKDAPSARDLHTAVWTGSEMIVWGGTDESGIRYFNTGAKYDPETDTWLATTTSNAPTGRVSHVAVWRGTEMIVWGGGAFAEVFDTGGRYNPFTDSWAATSTGHPPDGRFGPAAVWTGSEMIVWGGHFSDGRRDRFFDTGGRYNPSTDSWTATSTTNVPSARVAHTAVWTGSEMIVWGGAANFEVFSTGGRYCAQAGGGELTLESSFSRKTDRHNSFDVPLPGVEDRSDGKRLVIGFTFNNEVTGADSASTSCGTGGSLSVDPADSHTLLVTFNGQTCNQQEDTLTLTNVHDTLGNTLASAETSGCFLIGDVNGDGHVGNGDIGNIQGHLGQITDETNFGDVINADGRINNQDVQAARARRRESCP